MATTVLPSKQQMITVSGTSENDLNFDNVLNSSFSNLGYALITVLSGTAVQFDSGGVAIDATSTTLSSSGNNTKEIFEIQKGVKLKYKGGAGGEVFNISILGREK